MEPQDAVTLELRLVEELVERRLAGEGGIRRGILLHVGRLVAGHRGPQVDEDARQLAAVDVVVADLADRAVPVG